MDQILENYILDSYNLLQEYEKRGRYFHSLKPEDNSPTVVHKKTNQLTFVIEGNGIVVLNGKTEYIEKGKCVIVNAGTLHQFKATSDKLTLFHIHIPDEGRDNDRYIIEGDDYNRFD